VRHVSEDRDILRNTHPHFYSERHMRKLTPRKPLPRQGFTLIELLVVIAIITVLISMIAPAVQAAREAARRAECLNNMKNICLATHNHASTHNGKLPALMDVYQADNGARAQFGWGVALLPYMEASTVYDRMTQFAQLPGPGGNMKLIDNTTFAGTLPDLYLKVFACPNDTNKLNRGGGSSYAANAGYYSQVLWGAPGMGAAMQDTSDPTIVPWRGGIPSQSVDWWASSDSRDANNSAQGRATGAFVHRVENRSTLDGISSADGLTNTVFFAENLQSDNWASPNIAYNAIGAPVGNTSFDTATNQGDAPAPDLYQPRGSSGVTLRLWTDWSLVPVPGKDGRINRNQNAGIGQAPRPSSAHTGGLVIVAFGDGAARPVSDNIDQGVWARQLSGRGTSDYNQLLEGSN
jgi:prepilin-type N-terminal cleavage/methylation domain-containing protein